MNRFYQLLLVFILISFIVPVSNASEELSPVQRMPHLLAALKKNPNDIQALIDASFTYFDLCDYEGAKQMATRLATAGQHDGDSIRALFYSSLLLGRAALMTGHAHVGIDRAKQALDIANRHNMASEKAMASELLGFGYVITDLDLTKGLTYYTEALNDAKAAGNLQLAISILNNISEAYRWKQDFSGINYAEEALTQSREADYKYGILTSLLNVVHFKLEPMRDAQGYSKMIEEIKSLQNKYGYVPHGEIEFLDGHLAMKEGNYQLATSIFADALENSAPVMPTFLRLKILMYYSWALMRMEDYEKANEVNKEALAISRASGYNLFMPGLNSSIAYCNEHLGNYEEAYSYMKAYQWQMDSLWILKQQEAFNRIRVENMVRLNESKISRQQSQINTRGNYIVVLSIIGGILVSLLILLFYFYRRKGQLVRAVVQREKEAVVREKLLRQSLEQAKAELEENNIASDTAASQSSPKLTEERMSELMVKFNNLMSEKKIYTDPNVSIKSMAEALGTNRTYLSQAINHVFSKSFPQVLSEYRVRAAIEMMNDPDCSLPLKAIASEVGFSSPSVFFTTFRNIMGMTPTAYRNSILE